MKFNLKSMILGCAVCTVLFMFSGCGKNTENSQEDGNSSTRSETSVKNSKNDNLSITTPKINFSDDGFAWVTYEIDNNSSQRKKGILDMSGGITTVDLGDGTILSQSDFCGGYSYVNYKSEDNMNRYMIVNTEGDIVLESPENEDYRVVCGGDGYFLVWHMVRSMTESKNLCGIINYKGEYLCNEQEKFMFADKSGDDWLRENGSVDYDYISDGFFQASWKGTTYSTTKNVVLNANEKNESSKLELARTDEDGDYIEDFSTNVVGIYNNSVIWYSTTTKMIYCNNNELISLDGINSPKIKYYDGLIFVANVSNTLSFGENITDGKFYDLNGNMILDVSQYNLYDTVDSGKFVDGYAALVVIGADYGYYLMIVDKSGKCSFEPIQMGGNVIRYGKSVVCGIYNRSDNSLNNISIVDPSGKITDCEFMRGMSVNTKIINDAIYNPDLGDFFTMKGDEIIPHLVK